MVYKNFLRLHHLVTSTVITPFVSLLCLKVFKITNRNLFASVNINIWNNLWTSAWIYICNNTIWIYICNNTDTHQQTHAPPWGLSCLRKELSATVSVMQGSSKELSSLVAGRVWKNVNKCCCCCCCLLNIKYLKIPLANVVRLWPCGLKP